MGGVGVSMAAALIYASLVEWFVHRVVYHRVFVRLHGLHHAEYAGARFQQPGSYYSLQPWWFELLVLGLHAPVLVWLAGTIGAAPAWSAFGVLAVYAAASNYLHTAIHRPCGRAIERTRWYRSLVVRHRAHHVLPDAHYNIPVGLADRCFGTVSSRR